MNADNSDYKPPIVATADELEAYKRGRAARINLIKKDKTFGWWLDWGNSVVAARHEAMRRAYTNQPIGTNYNAQHAKILLRERLHLNDDGRIETKEEKNTRKDAVAMIDNMHHPLDVRRRMGILEWRNNLDPSVRGRLNHPTSIMRRWKIDTEPVEDRIARQQSRAATPDESNPHLEALADAEGREDEARRHSQDLRVLLDRILREVDDLSEELRAAIEEALDGQPSSVVEKAPDTRTEGLEWTGSDDDGYLGHAFIKGERRIVYAVVPAIVRGLEHFEAKVIADPDADFTLSAEQLAKHHGTPITRELKGQRHPIGPVATPEEARRICEIVYGHASSDQSEDVR